MKNQRILGLAALVVVASVGTVACSGKKAPAASQGAPVTQPAPIPAPAPAPVPAKEEVSAFVPTVGSTADLMGYWRTTCVAPEASDKEQLHKMFTARAAWNSTIVFIEYQYKNEKCEGEPENRVLWGRDDSQFAMGREVAPKVYSIMYQIGQTYSLAPTFSIIQFGLVNGKRAFVWGQNESRDAAKRPTKLNTRFVYVFDEETSKKINTSSHDQFQSLLK